MCKAKERQMRFRDMVTGTVGPAMMPMLRESGVIDGGRMLVDLMKVGQYEF